MFAGLFLLAALLPSPVRSQNTIVYSSSAIVVGDNDVVREWTNGLSVAYLTDVYGNDDAFAIIDKTSNTITLASFLSDARVYDFRVVDDSVFFCGSIFKNLQDRLLVGSFDINDVFNLGGSISYGVMSTPYHTYYGLSQVLRAWRMETYRNKAQESTHIVAVGGSYMNGGQYDCTTLLDAFYNGFQWEMYYYEDKDCDEYYTDITCTRRFVVASAMHATTNHCYFRVFSKTYPFISFPVYPNQLIEVLRGTPTGKVLVESVGEDSIALAYYESLTASAGSTIQLFNLSSAPAMPTLLQSIYI
ncbi:MAG: hypothetical protein K5864_02795, partial [Bacteroidales bacterium]|nr:hypothetical protein [Bacteroidales bacterium]